MLEGFDLGDDFNPELLDDELVHSDIRLPYQFELREYQKPFWDAVVSQDIRRSLCIWHRRAGKDKTHYNALLVRAMMRVGNYGYVFPNYNQGRRALWDVIDADGFRTIDHANPVEVKRNNTTMTQQLVNGSTISILGSDEDLDKLRGMNLIGVVLSEFSYQNPNAWQRVFRPMLIENKGFAWFNFTPQGRNHGYQLSEVAAESDNWFYSLLTVEDTKRHDGTPVVTLEDIEEERSEGVEEEIIQQEYYCSFRASIRGAYYSHQINQAWNEKRIARVPVDPMLDVHTFWDIGVDDMTAIWFVQIVGKEVRFVHYYEETGEGLPHYLNYLREFRDKHKIHFGQHWAPHDIAVREFSTGVSRVDAAETMGFTLRPAAKLLVVEGIDRARRVFPRCWFDKEGCKDGISALTDYRKVWDEKNQVYRNQPLHDWASHGADAFRTFAVVWYAEFGEPVTIAARPVKAGQSIWDF